ncbi:hypothetical protein [Kitasatospora camelliae]|uniref:MYXO-CTERM domain-containing protein n=1 Tax=Kitasatospora camelliae TaxID=3156397 RepID=A0AAU8JS66_9ACTN
MPTEAGRRDTAPVPRLTAHAEVSAALALLGCVGLPLARRRDRTATADEPFTG